MINQFLSVALIPLLFGAFETNSFQNTFCNIEIFGLNDLIECDKLKDTFIFKEGTNITLTMDNSTDTITIDATSGATPNQLYCSGTDKFSAYNGTSNDFICTSDDTGSAGEVNTASSLSPGESLISAKVGFDLPFKAISAGTNISLSSNSTTIEISAAGGLGEANTYSDLGFGENLITVKTGTDFPHKGIAAGNGISVSGNATDVTITNTQTQTVDTNLDSTTCSVGDFVSAVNNSTSIVTCSTPNIPLLDTTSCTAGDFITAINNSTGLVTCTTPSGGSGSQFVWTVHADEGNIAWSNMPLAVTQFDNDDALVNRLDMTYYSEFRIVINVDSSVGTTACKLGLQFNDGSWRGLDNDSVNAQSTTTISCDVATKPAVSSWATIHANARGDYNIRVVGSGGDGVADPQFGGVYVQFRT